MRRHLVEASESRVRCEAIKSTTVSGRRPFAAQSRGHFHMKITRRFTKAGLSPYASIPFRRATSEIKNPDGSVVFRLGGFDVPEQFSQVAADILAQKYFRKAGVARRLKRCEET